MNDMYETFSDCDIPYGIYRVTDYFPRYCRVVKSSWNQGDNISLLFNLRELPNYEQLPPLENKIAHFTFYNFRLEKIFEHVEAAQQEITITLPIDISHDIFVRGFYYCSLELQEVDTENPDYLINSTTLINRSDCAFYVR